MSTSVDRDEAMFPELDAVQIGRSRPGVRSLVSTSSNSAVTDPGGQSYCPTPGDIHTPAAAIHVPFPRWHQMRSDSDIDTDASNDAHPEARIATVAAVTMGDARRFTQFLQHRSARPENSGVAGALIVTMVKLT
jgi:hypothetical protein